MAKAKAKVAKPRAGRAPKAAATLAPETKPAEPSMGLRYVYVALSRAGVRVDEDSILRVGAAWACIRYIAESLATIDWRVFAVLPNGGKVPEPTQVADWLIHRQANPEMSAFTFREVMLAWANTWGNGYAEVERDMAGRPVWLWPLTPDRVCLARTASGRLVYDVHNPTGPNTALDAADVFHLRGLGWDGLLGYSLARVANESLGLSLAADQFAAAFFGNDATPSGVLETDGELSEPARRRLESDWQRAYGGPRNARRVAVLEQV